MDHLCSIWVNSCIPFLRKPHICNGHAVTRSPVVYSVLLPQPCYHGRSSSGPGSLPKEREKPCLLQGFTQCVNQPPPQYPPGCRQNNSTIFYEFRNRQVPAISGSQPFLKRDVRMIPYVSDHSAREVFRSIPLMMGSHVCRADFDKCGRLVVSCSLIPGIRPELDQFAVHDKIHFFLPRVLPVMQALGSPQVYAIDIKQL